MLRRTPAVLLLALAAPAGAEPPPVLVCGGREPEWSLRIDGAKATLATLGARGLTQTGVDGHLQEVGGRLPSFVYRGRLGTSGADLVAVITREGCTDSKTDAAEEGGPAEYSARVSLPEGAVQLGCCTVPATIAPAAEPRALPPPVVAEPPPVAAPPPQPVGPPPAVVGTTSTPPAASGEITALVLPDGRACQRTGTRPTPTPTYNGQRVNFDCGRRGGDTVALVGPLTPGSEGLLAARKAVIEWREGGLNVPPPIETTVARVSEVALADDLTCRLAGADVTLAFEGRRAQFTCGMKDGETVALLGDFEPVEGGFFIVRARIAQIDAGFVLRSSESILVTGPPR
jgi:uncharacterized membrane protein